MGGSRPSTTTANWRSTARSPAWRSSATGASCAPARSSPSTTRWPGSALVESCPSDVERFLARGDLAGEARLGDLRHQLAEQGAARDAELGRQLVAAHERRLGAGRAPRQSLGENLAGELDVARDGLLGLASTRREAIGD